MEEGKKKCRTKRKIHLAIKCITESFLARNLEFFFLHVKTLPAGSHISVGKLLVKGALPKENGAKI